MANSPQAKKRARHAETVRRHNASMNTRLRTHIKRVTAAVAEGNKDNATKAFKAVEPMIDSYVNKKLLHKNTAARKKSRLNAQIKKLGEAA